MASGAFGRDHGPPYTKERGMKANGTKIARRRRCDLIKNNKPQIGREKVV